MQADLSNFVKFVVIGVYVRRRSGGVSRAGKASHAADAGRMSWEGM